MLFLLACLSLASADPAPFRSGQAVTVRSYARLDEGPPARLRYRRSRSDLTGGTFPDGTPVFAERTEAGLPATWYRWDAYGQPHTTVRFEEGTPVEVVVHGVREHAVGTADWQEHSLGGLQLRLPPNATPADDAPPGQGLRFTEGPGRGVFWYGDADGTSDPTAFVADLTAGLGTEVPAPHATWLQDTELLRWTLRLDHPDTPAVAEVWLGPAGEGKVMVLAWTAPPGEAPADLDALAPGRAVLAMVRRTNP